jgi:hypothetical protein
VNVVCYGPWRAGTLLWQPKPGAWALTVACHAVFELAPLESPVVAKPLPLDPVDGESDDRAFVEPWGPVAPVKQHPEVIVVGHAYAPAGSKVTSLVARLGVGEVEKLIHVHGDCHFTQEGSRVGPAPFARMPLRWERAAGAPYTTNPVGVGMGPEAVADTLGRVHLPNLLPVGTTVSRRDQVVPPVSFGPIRPQWPSRIERLERYAAIWEADSWADQPLPEDFDISYFNAAPPDQTAGEMTGSERIVLENLHPRFPRLVTYLAAPAPCVVASSMGLEQSVPLRCDTLVFDTDRGLAILVWRGQVPLDRPEQDGVVFVSPALLGASSTGTFEGAVTPGAAALPFQGSAVTTFAGASLPARPALPFRPSVPAPPEEAADIDDTADTEPPTLRGIAQPERVTSAAPAEPADPPPIAAPPREVAAVEEPAPPSPPPAPAPPPRPTVVSSIEHCATVAGRLASLRADRAAVLKAEDLTPELWASHHERWLLAIDDELNRGKKKLLSAYDAAYVAALEEARGPIAAGEYARLAIAVERGKVQAALVELDLPGDAMMRIQRVWLARMVKDPRKAVEVRAATRAAAED